MLAWERQTNSFHELQFVAHENGTTYFVTDIGPAWEAARGCREGTGQVDIIGLFVSRKEAVDCCQKDFSNKEVQ